MSRFNRLGRMSHGVSLGVPWNRVKARSSSLNEEAETPAGRAISSVWGIALMDVQVYDSCALSEARRYIVWPRIFRCNAVSNGHLGEGPFCERPNVSAYLGRIVLQGKPTVLLRRMTGLLIIALIIAVLWGGQCFHEAAQ